MRHLHYFKWIVTTLSICALVWFIKDYQDKVLFKKTIESNERFVEKFDSLRISYIKLTDRQMQDMLRRDDHYKTLLKQNNIKIDRITSTMRQLFKYRDTTTVTTDMSDVLRAISENQPITRPFIDSTNCLVIKGNLQYTPTEFGADKNGSHISPLSINITQREFNGQTTAIAYWERNLWNVGFGIKTRFLGKKVMTAKVVDKCGQSQIVNIEKLK